MKVLSSQSILAVTLRAALYAGVWCFLFFPILWMLITALKSPTEIFVQFPALWPEQPTLDNFRRALSQSNMPLYLRNSLITAGGSALITTSVAAMAAFGFAKYRFRGRFWLMVAILAAQMFPFGVVLISLYSLLQSIGLIDTLGGLMIAYTVFSLPPATYIFFSFYANLPDELLEAARIDGAREWEILWHIALPLSLPALIAVGVYSFMWAWNDLLYSLTLVTKDGLRTIGPGLLLTFFGEMQQDWAGAMAASILAALPAVIAFAFLQKYFVQGLTAGAVKS
jgi:multiple sugar transport system permease protein